MSNGDSWRDEAIVVGGVSFARWELIEHVTQRMFELLYLNPKMYDPTLVKINGIGAAYHYRNNPNFTDWCGYLPIRVFEECGFPIHDGIEEAYALANTRTATELMWGERSDHYTEAVEADGYRTIQNSEGKDRLLAFGPECAQFNEEEGDIIILKESGHICYTHRVIPTAALTIEGNRGNKIGQDHWYLDNRGGRISFYLRVLRPGRGCEGHNEAGHWAGTPGKFGG